MQDVSALQKPQMGPWIPTYMCVYACVCVYVCGYTHTHTRIYTHTLCIAKPVNSNQYGFEQIDPQARVLNYCFQE